MGIIRKKIKLGYFKILDTEAIIDTGATYSAIRKDVVDKTDLVDTDMVTSIDIPDGTVNKRIYYSNIKMDECTFPTKITIWDQLPSEVVIGSDALQLATVDGSIDFDIGSHDISCKLKEKKAIM